MKLKYSNVGLHNFVPRKEEVFLPLMIEYIVATEHLRIIFRLCERPLMWNAQKIRYYVSCVSNFLLTYLCFLSLCAFLFSGMQKPKTFDFVLFMIGIAFQNSGHTNDITQYIWHHARHYFPLSARQISNLTSCARKYKLTLDLVAK